MTLMKRLIAFVGVAALMMGIIAGLTSTANANDDTIFGSVSIECPVPASVLLNGGDAVVEFEDISNILVDDSTETDEGAIELEVDMGCYWGPWHVNAFASRFTSGTTLQSFSADHLSLEDAEVDSYSLEDVPVIGPLLEPDASNAYFSCSSPPNPSAACDEEILSTSTSLLLWILTGDPTVPAPFVTEASYTGVLSDLPFLWGNNTYQSTITVELVMD